MMMKRVLKVGAVCVWVAICALAGAQTNQQKLADALSWLNKVKGGFATEVKADVPAIESILRRYFTSPDSLRASEEEIAVAFLETMPKDDDMGTRGGTLDKLRRFEALLGAKPKTTAVPPVKSSGPPKVVKTTTPAKAVKVTPKHKIPGIHSKATFSAISRTAPGGKTIGVVTLNISGRSKTVVEVLAGTSKLDAQKRAAVVAKRMQTLNKASRLWWTMLRVAQVKGQYVVGTGGKNFVITADSAFAAEWGLSPAELAKQLILKIRSSLDPEKSEMFGSRDLSPEELRIAAIDLRQQGDAIYASNPSGAEAKYKQAIANDPTYGIPYLRIADIRLTNKDPEGAKAILNEGLKVAGMSTDQKSALEAKHKTIS